MTEFLIRLVYCGICSLQPALSGTVVAATNQRHAWRAEIPSYAAWQVIFCIAI